MGPLLLLALLVVLFVALCYAGRPYWAWVLSAAVGLAWCASDGIRYPLLYWGAAALLGLGALVFGIVPLRRALITSWAIKLMGKVLPRMSETEREALEAGTVWWDRELFSGRPDWRKLVEFHCAGLAEHERGFLAGPVEELCRLLDDHAVTREGDLPEEVWQFIKDQGFMGMIIPREHGGLGFSAAAQSAVIARLTSRCVTAAVTVMVPNSLGPAELLLHYGTDEQKQHYLPRLARGVELPAFALTEPGAGTDAGSMTSRGVVCKGQWRGREIVGMRLTWNKRYITLAPVATVLGLAFKLHDPEHLLGESEELGITCALIPADTPGVEVGRRHDPLGIPFMNGPTTGHDVFVPLDCIIGGPAMAGKGWRMLMQSLAAGRGISLPALSAGAAQLATRLVGAYATVREQFGLPIGRFEGIEERLARIAGLTYLVDGARRLTLRRDRRRREALGRHGHHEGLHDRGHARGGQRRHGRGRRGRHLPRPAQRAGPRLPVGTDRHHRRGRQHPDALDDRLRPGRDPLPPLRAGGAGGRGRRRRRRASTAPSSATSAWSTPTARAPSYTA